MDTNILLESGTNELEILEFTIGNNSYGINVAKVKEILPFTKITPIPNSNPSIEGIFVPRDGIITAIDLAKALKVKVERTPEDMLVITNFNQLDIAFHVDSVVGIHKVEKEEIRDMGHFVPKDGYTDGAIRINKKLVILLNFENIVRDVNPEELTMQLEEDKIKEVFDE